MEDRGPGGFSASCHLTFASESLPENQEGGISAQTQSVLMGNTRVDTQGQLGAQAPGHLQLPLALPSCGTPSSSPGTVFAQAF